MRVMVMGPPAPAVEDAVRQIEAAGHQVVRCHDLGTPVFPCKALTGTCPLDEVPVDAALAVRTRTWPRPTLMDRGVTCAVRQRIPVVLAGTLVLNPYEEWASETVEKGGDVVGALERATEAALPAHAEVATAALHECLEAMGVEVAPGSRAEVVRRDGWLKVQLVAPGKIGSAREENVARHVIGALRRFDRFARGIDVGFEPGRRAHAWQREG